MSNRFERSGAGFIDLAVQNRKKAKTFLDDVDRLVDWRPLEKMLTKKLRRKPDAIGNPAYPALSMLKVLLLQRWYNLSDQAMDDALTDRISFCRFAGFSLDYDTPDSSTICRFRNSLIKYGLADKLFEMLNKQLAKHQLIVKQGVIVDATIVKSSRKPRKAINIEPENDEQEPEDKSSVTYSMDTEASWTVKAGKPHYGYKLHMSTDAGHGFIVGGHLTAANRADTRELMTVVAESEPDRGAVIFADKGYASNANRQSLSASGYKDGIMYKAHKNRPLDFFEKKINRKISSIRGKVERAFGTLKRDYGMFRTRYLGCAKTKLQFMLSAMAFNLKKAARMIT